MPFKVIQKGSFKATEKFLDSCRRIGDSPIFDKYGKLGVEALRAATPKDDLDTANSWYYEVHRNRDGVELCFYNSARNNGAPIALVLNYGHANRDGTYTPGYGYIDPAIRPVFDELSKNFFKEVSSK